MGKIEHDEKEHRITWRVSVEEAEQHTVGWKMLESNEISGFLSFDYYYIDNEVQFRYIYTSAYQRLEECLKRKKPDYDFVLFICQELLKILDNGQEYLLDLNACPVSPEWIFWNGQERKISICFLPGREGSVQKDFTTFVESLMQYLDYKDKALVELVYGLYDRVVSASFLPEQLLYYLRLREFTESEQALSSKERENSVKNDYETLKETEKQKKQSAILKKSDKHCDKYCFLKPVSMEGVLKFIGCFCETEKELIAGEKGEFEIGRGKDSVLCIPMGEISYRHAVLINEEEGIYIMDTASKNGTYLNGSKISAYVKTLCHTDDIITFADISYRIYITEEK